MIQLSYQPAFDPFHTIFRFLRLLTLISPTKPLLRDHVRILDFYMLFPFRADRMRVIPKHRRLKGKLSLYINKRPYNQLPDDSFLLARMGPIQAVALATLADHQIIGSAEWMEGLVVPESVAKLSGKLTESVLQSNKEERDLIDFLAALASEYDLLGVGGLKERTGLLEYRYDII